MSQVPSNSSGGKAPREKRRLSSEQPYKRPRTSTSGMPATRRSPARQPDPEPDDQVPLASIMKEFALLRKAMETRFSEADRKSDSLRGELVSKLDANDKAVSELQLAVTDVTLSVDDNQRAIHEVRAEVERREVELPGKVRAIVQDVLDKSRQERGRDLPSGPRHRPLGGARASSPTIAAEPGNRPNNEEAYNLARRSLRLWPVSREGDLDTRTREFLVSELLLDQQYVVGLVFTVRRTAGQAKGKDRDQTAPRVKDEVLVAFASTRERDEVRSHAKNLEKKGRGLRLEIPDYLWPSFRVLQDLAYELKQKNASLRRNIIFDDSCRDLRLDFANNSDWRSVSPDEARKTLQNCRPARMKKAAVTSAELEKLLGSQNESQDMSVNEEY